MEFKILLTSAAFVALSALGASAQENATLAVEGETILTSATAPAFAENLDKVYSNDGRVVDRRNGGGGGGGEHVAVA